MLTKMNGIFIVALGLVIGFFSLRVDYLEQQIESKDSTIATKQAELATVKLSIATVTQVNTELNATIGTLTQHLEDERKAVSYMENYTATVDASVNKAVGELKGLLRDEEDDCGTKRLPQPVIDRMWQHYRPQGGDADS
ncbi:TPA: hypothetical protein NG650_004188 [Vibrio parahaemolyticus]|uniref:hypothetical protein n=1 Tax=Vibrio TaxID=662 RepID=UPI00111F5C2C|nr:hypothetical protein [Vibrio parahaemolyticus]UVD31991.1 putative i-spanin subunit [Vibrio phage vB_Va_Val-yong3]MCF9536197.1 hypothetical protein [Vibrio parahaemolyticus]MCF9614199.1 hypothetical protein [Vibrio parahaemolyticus]MCQ6434781.1 hypothetical protein [Vibrio parahaemolyticus]MCQ6443966.1 hypothetical protein [Vibrio parahaemolyticus]